MDIPSLNDNKERVALDLMKYLCETVLSVDAKPHNRDAALNLYSECLATVNDTRPMATLGTPSQQAEATEQPAMAS